MKVLVNPFQLYGRPCPYLDSLREAGFEITFTNPHSRHLSEDEVIRHLDGTFATIAGSEPYTARIFEAAPQLRVVARFGVGHDKIDVDAATAHGVAVAMAFGLNHDAVADYTAAMILALGCRLFTHHDIVACGQWGCTVHPGVNGKTVGIVGLGRVGMAVVNLCSTFDMRLLGYDVLPDQDAAQPGRIERVSLDTLLRESDFVTLHLPLTNDTRHFINAERLRLMKPSAFLINTARGGIVDEDALVHALREGRLAGAALDVFEREPPAGSPLLGLRNVVLAPHAAGLDEPTEMRIGRHCAETILGVYQGRPLDKNVFLNPKAYAHAR